MPRKKTTPPPATEPLYAFWTYDLYPFVNGGIVNEERNYEGNRRPLHGLRWVRIDSYQTFVSPFAMVRGNAGKQLLADLEKLRVEHRAALRKVDDEFNLKLQQRLQGAGIRHPRPRVQ